MYVPSSSGRRAPVHAYPTSPSAAAVPPSAPAVQVASMAGSRAQVPSGAGDEAVQPATSTTAVMTRANPSLIIATTPAGAAAQVRSGTRSEERRVGKEGR